MPELLSLIGHMKFTDEFQKHLAAIRAIDKGPVGTEALEPPLLALVECCRRALPAARREIVACFVAALHEANGLPDELFTFSMHQLRLTEVLEAARGFAADADAGSRAACDRRSFLYDLQDAFSDDWGDRDLWPSLRPTAALPPSRS